MSDIMTVTPRQAANIIEHTITHKRPIMMWGSPGIGKSDIIRQIGKKLGRPTIDIRLILMEPTDLKGIPYYDPKTNSMKWSVSDELPQGGQGLDNAILFLDEIVSAPQSVQGAAYQLILDRKIGQYTLPEDCVIVAAGNHQSDRGVVHKMPSPLANRFVHINVECDFDSWKNWAANNGIAPHIIGYLSANPQNLFLFNPKLKDMKSFATPRTWAFISKMLEGENNLSHEELVALIGGTIGHGLAHEFIEYMKIADKMPDPYSILNGKLKKMNNDLKGEISGCYSLAVSLCNIFAKAYHNPDREIEGLKVRDFDSLFENFVNFIETNFETELVVFALKCLVADYKIRFSGKNKTFEKFTKKYKDVLLYDRNH